MAGCAVPLSTRLQLPVPVTSHRPDAAAPDNHCMRPCVARPDGSIEVLGGFRPAARSGSRVVGLTAADVVPLPEGSTLMHLPGRRAPPPPPRARPPPGGAGPLPVAAPAPRGLA